MAKDRWCWWCGLDVSRRKDGACQACNAYRAKYGKLPGPLVLERRAERMCA